MSELSVHLGDIVTFIEWSKTHPFSDPVGRVTGIGFFYIEVTLLTHTGIRYTGPEFEVLNFDYEGIVLNMSGRWDWKNKFRICSIYR